MKRLPAFVLACVLAVLMVFPVSALELSSSSVPSYGIEIRHSNGSVTYPLDDNDGIGTLSSLPVQCYYFGGTFCVPLTNEFLAQYRALRVYSTASIGSNTWGIAVPVLEGDTVSIWGFNILNSDYTNMSWGSVLSSSGSQSLYASTSLPTVSVNQNNINFLMTGNIPPSTSIRTGSIATFQYSSSWLASVSYGNQSTPASYVYSATAPSAGYMLFGLRSQGSISANRSSSVIVWGDGVTLGGNDDPSWLNSLPEFALDSTLRALGADKTFVDIIDAIHDAGNAQGPLDKLVSGWQDNFSGQMEQVESGLSSSNPALPNGGDIGGFVSEISDGLGIQGSSFSGTEFNSATSGFTGSDSTGIGGPWEFFTQGVADDLSGDSPAGIDADYDPILAWVEDSERWLKSWGSYNP